MTFVPAPGVAKVTVKGLIGTQPWNTIYYFHVPASPSYVWTSGDLQTLADTAWAQWGASIANGIGANVKQTEIDAIDIGSVTGLAAVHTGSVAGTGSGALEPSSMCANIYYQIMPRYRGGHPRGYWPFGYQSLLNDESHWSPTALSTFSSNIAAYFNAIIAALAPGAAGPIEQCVPRWTYTIVDDPVHHKYLRHRTGYSHSDKVLNRVCQPTVGSQRRRLRL